MLIFIINVNINVFFKHTKKESKKKHLKDVKISVKKKKTKGKERPEKDIKILLKKKEKAQ